MGTSNATNLKLWPTTLRSQIIRQIDKDPQQSTGEEFLKKYNWPNGLKHILIKSCKRLPLRFFIVDDSGSMNIGDGKRLVTSGGNSK